MLVKNSGVAVHTASADEGPIVRDGAKSMVKSTSIGRQTKWGANISVNLLRQVYDPILMEPIPEALVKAASVLAQVAVRHLAAIDPMRADSRPRG